MTVIKYRTGFSKYKFLHITMTNLHGIKPHVAKDCEIPRPLTSLSAKKSFAKKRIHTSRVFKKWEVFVGLKYSVLHFFSEI